MTLDAVRQLLLKRMYKYRSHNGIGLRGWCKEHHVSVARVSEFLNGVRNPTSDILNALNLEWRIVRKTKGLSQ